VVFDKSGNLYGTCVDGGNGSGIKGGGILFELTPGSSGWSEKELLQFGGSNGALPVGTLVLDSAGNLFGTTATAGTSNNGTVFEYTP
jgi:hypothetical protein